MVITCENIIQNLRRFALCWDAGPRGEGFFDFADTPRGRSSPFRMRSNDLLVGTPDALGRYRSTRCNGLVSPPPFSTKAFVFVQHFQQFLAVRKGTLDTVVHPMHRVTSSSIASLNSARTFSRSRCHHASSSARKDPSKKARICSLVAPASTRARTLCRKVQRDIRRSSPSSRSIGIVLIALSPTCFRSPPLPVPRCVRRATSS